MDCKTSAQGLVDHAAQAFKATNGWNSLREYRISVMVGGLIFWSTALSSTPTDPTPTDKTPPQPPRLVGVSDLLVQAAQAFKSGGRQSVALAFFGIFLPQILASWILAAPAAGTAEGLWKIARSAKSSAGITVQTLPAMLEEVSRFFGPLLFTGTLCWFIFGVAYASLVYLSLHHMRPWAFPRVTPKDLAADMAKLVLRRGFLFAALVLSMGFATQAFAMTSLFLGALALMAPVLMIAEHKGVVRSLTQAITLRYARQVPMGGWSAFLSLVTIGGLFFFFEFALEALASSTVGWLGIHLPPGISRQVPGMPFTYGYALVDAVHALASTSLVALLPGTTAALYMQVHFRNSARARSIRA